VVAVSLPLVYFQSRFGALHDPQSEQLREALGWDMPSLSGIGPPTPGK
jgi:hypothetical protein